MTCPNKQGCPLFPVFRLQAALHVWQTNYCDSDFVRCERYVRKNAGEAVPPNLLPNGSELATNMLPAKEQS